MRDRSQLMNAANVRLGRTSYDYYESAEPSYTLYTDRDYEILLDDLDPEELERHYGKSYRQRRDERNRKRAQENFRGRVNRDKRYADVENEINEYVDEAEPDYLDALEHSHSIRERLDALQRHSGVRRDRMQNDERRRNSLRRSGRGSRKTSVNRPWNRSDAFSRTKKY